MAIKESQVKRIGGLQELIDASDNAMLIVHDGAGMKKCSVKNLKKDLKSALSVVESKLLTIDADGAGAHNSVYRGKNMGSSVTAEQWAAISSGTFKDLYIGDYWTIGGRNWRIADFDYFLQCGDTATTAHHVVIVPDTSMYNAKMNETNTTAGGYAGSDMRTTNLEQAKTIVKEAFGDHVLKHRIYLTNAATGGHPSAGAWFDSEVDLMSEQMVYGGPIVMPMANGSAVYTNYRVEKSQLALFRYRPDLISNRNNFWLRDVVTASDFAAVYGDGRACYDSVSTSYGVRPAFCIS